MRFEFLALTLTLTLTLTPNLANQVFAAQPEFADKPVVTGKPMTSPVAAHSLVLTGVACFLTGWLAARRTYRT